MAQTAQDELAQAYKDTMWRNFYADRGPFQEKFAFYQRISRPLTNLRFGRILNRQKRELHRLEHQLHERMGEVGRYLWCERCHQR